MPQRCTTSLKFSSKENGWPLHYLQTKLHELAFNGRGLVLSIMLAPFHTSISSSHYEAEPLNSSLSSLPVLLPWLDRSLGHPQILDSSFRFPVRGTYWLLSGLVQMAELVELTESVVSWEAMMAVPEKNGAWMPYKKNLSGKAMFFSRIFITGIYCISHAVLVHIFLLKLRQWLQLKKDKFLHCYY